MTHSEHPPQLDNDPLKRQALIAELVRQNDDAAIQQLEYYATHDSVPKLRQLAKKALRLVRYRQPINSLYADDALRYLQQAVAHHEQGFEADALHCITRALTCDPRLKSDSEVQQLASEITGIENAIPHLMGSEVRNETFRRLTYLTSTPPSIYIPGIIITLSVMCIYLVSYVFANYEDVSLVFDQWEDKHYRTEIRYLYEGLAYHLFVPDAAPPPDGWSMLVILNEEGAVPDTLMQMFVRMSRENNVIMMVPAFPEYRYPYEQEVLPELDQMISKVRESYPIHASGPVLFGYSAGGEIASLYAHEYPDAVAAVITSGAPYIYPSPDEDMPFRIIYGYDDPLLPHYNDNEVVFTDMTTWDFPMNYTVIENIGRIVNDQQVNITASVIQEVATR
jgi:hypothetical protein